MPCATCVRYEYECEYPSTKRHPTTPTNSGTSSREIEEHMPPTGGQPSVHELQKHPLSVGARFHHRGILDPTKTRFVRANSAMAFPRILGMDLESESIPRLHSFAWHLGLRREEDDAEVRMTAILSWADMQGLAASYFGSVNRELGILEEGDFMARVSRRYANPEGYSEIDAVALNVAALGSFFGPNQHPMETEAVRCAKALMVAKRLELWPSLDTVAAWILRTVYLRLTSRPHASWLASSITLHQAEANGLHKEMQTIAVVYPAADVLDRKLIRTRRKLFWVARALNIIFSFEFGRSRINFDVITTKKIDAEAGGHGHVFVELAEMLPSDFVDREREPDPVGALAKSLTRIEESQTDSPFIALLKADLGFAIYRRLWLMSLTDAKDRAETVLKVGRSALAASRKLLETRTPWWNVVHVPFQFLCVAVAVGTPRSLGDIGEAMRLLQQIADAYPTHMVKEAFNQAVALVRMSRARKERELDELRHVADMAPLDEHGSAGSTSGMTEAPDLDWTVDLPFEWDIFLNPALVMSSQQQGQFLGFGDAVTL